MSSFLPKIWFKFIHTNFLVYNICWEDSDIDRKLLDINSKTDLLTITSAGCNILNYLLDSPRSICCIDINPKQTALLELKVALIKHGDHQLFYEFFGVGKSKYFIQTYAKIRNELTAPSKSFWDQRINYFSPNGKGLFYSGGTGLFARFLNQTLNRKNLRDSVERLVFEENKEIRIELFDKIERTLWNGFESKLWKSPLVLSLAGVPKSQREAVGDINEFMKNALRTIFVTQSASTNYFWRVYLEGHFSRDCCPDYLKADNFDLLQSNINKLHISTGGISDFLDKTDNQFTHTVLLDYMDWLVVNNENQLNMNWEKLLLKSFPESKILFRTAYHNVDFIPEYISSKMSIKKIDQDWVSKNDKVGTYSGTYLGVVK